MKTILLTVLLLNLLLISLSTGEKTDMLLNFQKIIQKAKDNTCRYARYGIDRSQCKQYRTDNLPMYPGLSYNPFLWERFTLPIYKPIFSKSNTIYSLTKLVETNVCSFQGFTNIYQNLFGRQNSFWNFGVEDYAKLYGEFIDIQHDCKMTVENYALISTDGYGKQFDDNFVTLLKMLPEIYNETIYDLFFKAYSPFVAIGSYGASVIHTYTKSQNLGVNRYFEYDIVSGGSGNITDKESWINSILSNPTMVEFEIVRMSKLINHLVSQNVTNNIIKQEDYMISQTPDRTFFDQVRQNKRPCKMIEVSGLSIVNQDAVYICPTGVYVGHLRIYNYEIPNLGTGTFASFPTCNRNINPSSVNRNFETIPSVSIIPHTIEPKEPFTKPLRFDWHSYDTTVEPVVFEAAKILIGYCSPVRYRGMIELSRYLCSSPAWGHTIMPTGNYPNCKQEYPLCYVYPFGTGTEIQGKKGLKQVCAETIPY